MRCQDPISTVILAQKVLELFENPIVDSLKMDLEKLGKGSKKNLEFSRFSGWVGGSEKVHVILLKYCYIVTSELCV